MKLNYIFNNNKKNFYKIISEIFEDFESNSDSEEIIIVMSYIFYKGLTYFDKDYNDSLISRIINILTNDGKITIITTLDRNVTEPKALFLLNELQIKYPKTLTVLLYEEKPLHSKLIIALSKNHSHLLIGSANISVGGLLNNEESGFYSKLENDNKLIIDVTKWINNIFQCKKLFQLNFQIIREYQIKFNFYKKFENLSKKKIKTFDDIDKNIEKSLENVNETEKRIEYLLDPSKHAELFLLLKDGLKMKFNICFHGEKLKKEDIEIESAKFNNNNEITKSGFVDFNYLKELVQTIHSAYIMTNSDILFYVDHGKQIRSTAISFLNEIFSNEDSNQYKIEIQDPYVILVIGSPNLQYTSFCTIKGNPSDKIYANLSNKITNMYHTEFQGQIVKLNENDIKLLTNYFIEKGCKISKIIFKSGESLVSLENPQDLLNSDNLEDITRNIPIEDQLSGGNWNNLMIYKENDYILVLSKIQNYISFTPLNTFFNDIIETIKEIISIVNKIKVENDRKYGIKITKKSTLFPYIDEKQDQ